MMNEPALLRRFIEVLDAYGSHHDQWPVDERDQLRRLLANSKPAQQLLEEAATLDAMLDQCTVPESDQEFRKQVFKAIPFGTVGLIDRLLDWIIPAGPKLLWRPAVAVSVPLLVGFVLGLTTTEPAESLDAWEEDIYLVGVQQTGDTEL